MIFAVVVEHEGDAWISSVDEADASHLRKLLGYDDLLRDWRVVYWGQSFRVLIEEVPLDCLTVCVFKMTSWSCHGCTYVLAMFWKGVLNTWNPCCCIVGLPESVMTTPPETYV